MRLAGRTCEAVRRRAPGNCKNWCRKVHFQPLTGAAGLLGVLGTIQILAAPADVPFALPEKLMSPAGESASTPLPPRRRWLLVRPCSRGFTLNKPNWRHKRGCRSRFWANPASASNGSLARTIHALSDRGANATFACLDAEKLCPRRALWAIFSLGARSRALGLGTVYLREPAALPREWQSRLAETVSLGENGDFPRLIVGYRSDPGAEIQTGRLLDEFHCAVSPVMIALPPLRDRLAELPRLIDIFLERARNFETHKVKGVGDEAMTVLRAHGWPGNLGELQEVVREACRRAKGERIELADLPFAVKHGALPPERRLPLDTLLEQVERRLIVLALKLAQNNQTRAAELLEIWRPRLMRRMEKFGIKDAE